MKVGQAEIEINKKKEEVKSGINKEYVETEGKQKLLRNVMANNVDTERQKMDIAAEKIKNDLQNKDSSE